MTEHILSKDDVATAWQRFSLRALALFGWHVNVAPLPGPRGVVIVYPHTSNWDFVIGLFARWALGIRFRWLGKESLFRGLTGTVLGAFLRACGGVPVERGTSTGAISRLAGDIRAAEGEYWLALAPEGTRSYRDSWRSGFYHIALAAGVPLGIATIDYARKQVRMVDYLTLTGDLAEDMARIRKGYEDCRGLRHALAAPIRFAAEEGRRDRA